MRGSWESPRQLDGRFFLPWLLLDVSGLLSEKGFHARVFGELLLQVSLEFGNIPPVAALFLGLLRFQFRKLFLEVLPGLAGQELHVDGHALVEAHDEGVKFNFAVEKGLQVVLAHSTTNTDGFCELVDGAAQGLEPAGFCKLGD